MASLLASCVSLLAVVALGSCDLEGKPFVERAGKSFNGRVSASILTVPNGGTFGEWTWTEMCPEGFYASGFSLRVESNQYGVDDTALNGIRLYCSQGTDRSYLYTIESHVGYFGEWSDPQWCPESGFLKSFQLRVESEQGIFGDDTSANNIRFRCTSNPALEGRGLDWGEYGSWSQECLTGGICGIEVKMEYYQYGLDDSTLNDVRFHCCA